VLGAVLRLAHLARPFNGVGATAWNEGHYALIALNFARYGLWTQHNELGVDYTFSPGVPWLIWLAFKAFGPSEWAARLPIALFGIAAIPLVAALVRRHLASEQIALGAAAFAATIPETVYFAQNVQLDTPSICCALAGAVAILKYRDTERRGELVAAGIWVTLAVWFKFTTALLYPAYLALWWTVRPRPTWTAAGRAGAFAGLTALPSAAWVLYGKLTHLTLPSFYQRDWDLRGLIEVLIELPLMVGTHFFPIVFILLVVGIPIVFRWRARLRGLGIWCCPWVLLYVLAPYSALNNRYYDLPATYLLTVPAALGLWMPLSRRTGAALGGAMVIALGLLVALLAAYDLWDPTTDRLARTMTAHPPPLDPTPFYSAKLVAQLPRKRTVVDAPQTMFYAGGDPEWISIVAGNGDVRDAIDGEKFDYVLLNDYWHQQAPYYAMDDVLRARLVRHHYVQIAPAAWAHTAAR
jgi:4-amino-4-deoxy-L-arabinose transferase-like glycosyltransferase